MDRLESMGWLLAVIEAGSLSAAAKRLGKPLSTVSRRITDLESHLGIRLLVRSTRRLDLTEAGRRYTVACRQILADVADAERTTIGEYVDPKGLLTITAPVLFGRLHVLPTIVTFLRAYPDIDVQLVSADRIVHLIDDEIDLAVRIGHLPDSRLIAIGLGSVRRVVCASPDYLAAHGVPAEPTALAAHACIRVEKLSGAGTWGFEIDGLEQRVPLRSRLIVNSIDTAVEAAVAGLGLTQVLSYQIEDEVRAGQLVTVLGDFASDPLPVHLVYTRRGVEPAKLRAFIDFARPRLRESLAALR